MNSSDEHIDEELRKALRERFDNFERLPDPTLREKVFKGLGGGTSIVQTGVVASLLLLIAVTASVYMVSLSIERKNQMVAGVQQVTREFSEALKATEASPEQIASRQMPEIATPKTGVVSDSVQAVRQAVEVAHVVPARAARVTQETPMVSKRYKYSRADLGRIIAMVKSDPSFGSLWIDDRDISPEDRAFLSSELNKIASVGSSRDSIAAGEGNGKELEGPSLADQDIGVLDHRPMALPQYNWQPDSLVTPEEPHKRYELLFKERWTIVTALTPLRTFQILTVRSGNGVVYQNFVLPGKISAETVGYKFSAGVERKGFQLLLNYGQFKQSYRYEIATSEFAVGPDLSGNYEVVRKGIPQYENSTVRLVGMSLKKHTVRRSHFLRNYFGDFGAEFSRDLTSKKNMVWVNAGFGKELFAGNHTVMTVGPYFEYSLSKLRNPDNPFKIQPYQIGLSVGLRYTKK